MEQKITNLEIKRRNRTSIFQLLRDSAGLSRQDIVKLTGLSLPTVTQNLTELTSEGLARESGYIGNTGGRRAVSYTMDKKARTAIGIDITKNHITTVALDMGGSIITSRRKRIPFCRSDGYYRQLGRCVADIIAEAEIEPSGILGVGIGIPGLITSDGDTVYYGEVLNNSGSTREEIIKYIPYPARLIHDTEAACLAETWNNSEIKNAFFLMLSSSVGGAVHINSQQYLGDNVRSGEVGHMTIVPNGKRCYCGRCGCVDAYCASSLLTSVSGGNTDQFFEMLRRREPDAVSLWEKYLDHLATTIANIRTLFDCDIIIGGQLGSGIAEHMDELRKLVADRCCFENNADFLHPCKYQKEASAAGAALSYISDFLKTI